MISMNGFGAEPVELRDAMRSGYDRVAASNYFILGPEVAQFESEWAEVAGTTHAIGVANGLDAIEISLRALGIGPGDEVITTPMTAFASILGIIRAGATPVLADINADTALLSRESVARCISPRTRAVLLVHLYGQVRDMPAWVGLADDNDIELIEDCAQSHLASEHGQRAGTFGRISPYSFYPTKNLGAMGDAGAVVTSDDELAETSRMLRNYGQSVRYEHPLLGLNSRLDELQAAILRARLPWLERFTHRRREIADRYRAGIDNAAVSLLAPPVEPSAHVHHLFVVTTEHREALAAHLDECGVQTLIHYPVPAHHQPPCVDIARDPLGLPAAEAHAQSCLSIPSHAQLTDDEVSAVIDAVNSFRA
jgi:dTDP-4-amino-4,6-dideoxygalactose transaminase